MMIQKAKKKMRVGAIVIGGFLFSLLTSFVFIAEAVKIEFKNPIQHNSIEEIALALLDIAIQIGAVIAVFMFIVTGFRFVTAQGDPSKIEQARSTLLWTSVGTVVLLGAKAILEVIQNTIEQL